MIIANVSDLHCGSAIGLWPEGIFDDDGGELRLNPLQKWLLERWWMMLDDLLALPERPVVVIDGDPIQGVKFPGQLTTDKPRLQRAGALAILKPLRELADRMYMVHSTGAHGGPAGEDVNELAQALDCVRQDPAEPGTEGSPLWWELYLRPGGHVIHFTHHVSATSLPFYEATAPLRDLYVLISECYRMWGQAGPGVEMIVRAHRHRAIHVHKPPRLNVLVSPCWQLKGEFPFKIAASSFPDIGYSIIRAERGKPLAVELHTYPLPMPHIEVLEGLNGGADHTQ